MNLAIIGLGLYLVWTNKLLLLLIAVAAGYAFLQNKKPAA
jgi:hypothetical protein